MHKCADHRQNSNNEKSRINEEVEVVVLKSVEISEIIEIIIYAASNQIYEY